MGHVRSGDERVCRRVAAPPVPEFARSAWLMDMAGAARQQGGICSFGDPRRVGTSRRRSPSASAAAALVVGGCKRQADAAIASERWEGRARPCLRREIEARVANPKTKPRRKITGARISGRSSKSNPGGIDYPLLDGRAKLVTNSGCPSTQQPALVRVADGKGDFWTVGSRCGVPARLRYGTKKEKCRSATLVRTVP
jgi:hypothetical protein